MLTTSINPTEPSSNAMRLSTANHDGLDSNDTQLDRLSLYPINFEPHLLSKLFASIENQPVPVIGDTFTVKRVESFIAKYPQLCQYHIQALTKNSTNRLLVNYNQPFIQQHGIDDANQLISALFGSLYFPATDEQAFKAYIQDFYYSLDLLPFDVALYLFVTWFNYHKTNELYSQNFLMMLYESGNIHIARITVNIIAVCRLFLVNSIKNTQHNDILEKVF
ncbi:hypothetical protein FEF33_14165 (plasmid) [Moraxella osloensis]|jgi:hypothetical protein|uniref:Uncharacterized protein n=1 Tax=Faucicola osloensis TaxID=34062 RepID=A0AAW6TE77_FAUOS|nr:hypothetical protein [Moraxella osloensis]MDI4510223.1 hypothetical protein [Moraxella osloensis]QCR87142.1 hypothetical protein FEF33_14165 [Moraxella osloensis]BDD46076.1 hypothetical protein 5 [Moraxellaceae bacterium]